ncbi:MAG: hypothetical protein V2I57_15585 [Xanthomonadales bacterium]|nr:hypothetical protein [Xanthomonadales bacterium]
MIAITWLCFLIAAMPCMTAWAACCPMGTSTGSGPDSISGDLTEAGAHGHHGASPHAGHHGDPSRHDRSASAPADHDCGDSGGTCCDEALPTLEDRSPRPLPSAGEAGLIAAMDFDAVSGMRNQPGEEHATGPPSHLRPHPRTHLEHCSFLI